MVQWIQLLSYWRSDARYTVRPLLLRQNSVAHPVNHCSKICTLYRVAHYIQCLTVSLIYVPYCWTWSYRAGMVAALTNESATSKSVYFSLCTSEMIYITHLLAPEPEKLAGPLLADTYVTLLKGRNAWYGQKLAKGELTLEMGDSIKGKGTIQVCAANPPSGQCEVCLHARCLLLKRLGYILILIRFCDLGCFCSQCILWTAEPGKPKRDASRNQEGCCSCWAMPNTQNTIQNFDQEVGNLYWCT